MSTSPTTTSVAAASGAAAARRPSLSESADGASRSVLMCPTREHDGTTPGDAPHHACASLAVDDRAHLDTQPSADAVHRIRIGLWNIGGGGVTGADSHWGHVEDALRPGGPLHDLDVLICTEAKLRDGTMTASLGQRAAAARSGRCDAPAFPILYVTALNAAHAASYDEDDAGVGATDRAMKHYNRRPWGGVLVLVINRRLRPTYVSGHKLGLLCVKLEWKPAFAPPAGALARRGGCNGQRR